MGTLPFGGTSQQLMEQLPISQLSGTGTRGRATEHDPPELLCPQPKKKIRSNLTSPCHQISKKLLFAKEISVRLSANGSWGNHSKKENSDVQGRSSTVMVWTWAARPARHRAGQPHMPMGSGMLTGLQYDLASRNTQGKLRISTENFITKQELDESHSHSNSCPQRPRAVMALTLGNACQVYPLNGPLDRALGQSAPRRAIWCCCT